MLRSNWRLVAIIVAPKMLQDGEEHSESTPIGPGYPSNDNVKSLKAWDSTGRDWKLPRWKMHRLHKEFKKYV